MTSSIRILGAYRMDPTPELFAEAMKIKYNGPRPRTGPSAGMPRRRFARNWPTSC